MHTFLQPDWKAALQRGYHASWAIRNYTKMLLQGKGDNDTEYFEENLEWKYWVWMNNCACLAEDPTVQGEGATQWEFVLGEIFDAGLARIPVKISQDVLKKCQKELDAIDDVIKCMKEDRMNLEPILQRLQRLHKKFNQLKNTLPPVLLQASQPNQIPGSTYSAWTALDGTPLRPNQICPLVLPPRYLECNKPRIPTYCIPVKASPNFEAYMEHQHKQQEAAIEQLKVELQERDALSKRAIADAKVIAADVKRLNTSFHLAIKAVADAKPHCKYIQNNEIVPNESMLAIINHLSNADRWVFCQSCKAIAHLVHNSPDIYEPGYTGFLDWMVHALQYLRFVPADASDRHNLSEQEEDGQRFTAMELLSYPLTVGGDMLETIVSGLRKSWSSNCSLLYVRAYNSDMAARLQRIHDRNRQLMDAIKHPGLYAGLAIVRPAKVSWCLPPMTELSDIAELQEKLRQHPYLHYRGGAPGGRPHHSGARLIVNTYAQIDSPLEHHLNCSNTTSGLHIYELKHKPHVLFANTIYELQKALDLRTKETGAKPWKMIKIQQFDQVHAQLPDFVPAKGTTRMMKEDI